MIDKSKILGTIITSDLKWDDNCANKIAKFNKRLTLLRKVASFCSDTDELRNIYITFCRPVLEQSCELWTGSLTTENRKDIERCQKTATKIILKKI